MPRAGDMRKEYILLTNWGNLVKLNICLLYDPAIPFQCIYCRTILRQDSRGNKCMRMFIKMLCVGVGLGNTLSRTWMSKVWWIQCSSVMSSQRATYTNKNRDRP